MEDKPFNTSSLREITDLYDIGEISYGKMVDLINEKAIIWGKEHVEKAIDDALNAYGIIKNK